MTGAQILARTSTMGLTEAQKLELVQTYATDAANYTTVESLAAVSTSQATATGTTTGLSTAFKGLAASIGISTTALGVLLGVVAAVGVGFVAWNAYNDYIDGCVDSASEAADALSEQNDTLAEQKSRITELKESLASGTLTEQEAYAAKSELFEIQQQLNATYGDQAAGIDLVNGSLETQIGLLDKLSASEANKFLNENNKGVEKAEKEITKDDRRYMLASSVTDPDTFSRLQEIADKYEGITATMKDSGEFQIMFTGDASQAEEEINNFATDVRALEDEIGKTSVLDGILNLSEDALSSAQEVLDTYGKLCEQAQKYQLIADSKLYESGSGDSQTAAKWLKDYTDAVQAYNDALLTGDQDNIGEAATNFNELDTIIQQMIGDADGLGIYSDIFKDVSDQLNTAAKASNEFEQALSGDLADSVDKIKDLKPLDLLTLDKENVTAEQSKALDDIVQKAKELGVVTEDTEDPLGTVIDLLVEFGVVSDGIAENTEEAASSYDDLISKASTWLTTIDNVNAALVNSISGSGLTATIDEETGALTGNVADILSAYQDLEGFDAESLFERTANGIHLNREALRQLQAQEEANNKAAFLKEEKELREQLNEAIATQASLEADSQDYINNQNTIDSLQTQLQTVQMLSSAYDGATSAYQKWLDAQSNGEEGDMYDSFQTALERGKDLYDKGLVGTEEFRAIANLFSYDDISTASIEDVVSAYENSLPAVKKFFTEGKEGCDQFVLSMKKISDEKGLNWVEQLEDGSFKFNTGDDERIAQELGISVEAVQAIYKKLKDYGADVQIGDTSGLDSINEKLEEQKTKAKEAQEALKEMNETISDSAGNEIDLSFDIDALSVEELQEKVKQLEDYKATLSVDDDEYQNVQALIDGCNAQIEKLNNTPVSISVDISDEDGIANLKSQISSIPAGASTNISVSVQNEEQLNNAVTEIEKLPDNTTANVTFNVSNEEEADALSAKIDELNTNGGGTITYSLNVVSGTNETITPEDQTVKVNYELGHQDPPEDQTATVKYTADTSKLPNSFSTITRTVKYVATGNTSGASPFTRSAGTLSSPAHAHGTATPSYASGTNVSIRQNQEAVVNELGEEGLIRNGILTRIKGGMQKIRLKVGDILLNHKQLEELDKNGYVTSNGGRGRLIGSFAKGTVDNIRAFVRGTMDKIRAYSSGSNYTIGSTVGGSGSKAFSSSKKSSSKSSSSKKSSSKSSSSADDFKETLDWIEIMIDRIERAISSLDLKASSVYKNWSTRNSALKSEISKITEEISVQQQAYNRYIKQANSVGLSESYAKLVRNGKIDISTITNEDLADKIEEYQQWYEKALDCKDAVEDLNESLGECYETAFDNVLTQYDSILSVIEFEKNLLDEYISQTEESGYITSTRYYEALIKTEQANITQMQKEKAALEAALNDAVRSGAIVKNSEAWSEMCDEINEVTLALEEASTAITEYGNSVRDIEWEIFDLLQSRISRITDESDFLIDLLSNDDLYDDRGQLTNEGLATMGLHGLDYNTYMAQADKYAEEMLKIDRELADDPYNQDLAERREELLELQQEMILAAEDEKQAIKEMVEDGIELELDALNDLIDKYKDAVDNARNLYDYQKEITGYADEIASLEKQLQAYSGDTSEESKAKIQQITVDLKEARENLEESQYDRFIEDQEKLLDELYDEYEQILNERLDNIDALISDMITEINNGASAISTALSEKAESVGYTLSDNMTAIWDTNSTRITDVLTVYGSDFIDSVTTVNSTLGTINTNLQSMVTALNTIAGNKTGSVSAASATTGKAASGTAGTSTGTGTKSTSTATTTSTTTKSSTASGGSSSSKGSFFIYKKDSYPKSKLNVNTSIVDRLKYHNYDSSFSARSRYYKGMGFSGTYTGSAGQNTNMINWMKKNGFASGGTVGDLISRTGEDGFVLARKGEEILSLQKIEALGETFNKINPVIDGLNTLLPNLPSTTNNNTSNIDNINFEITLPNVTNYTEFKRELQNDKIFVRWLKTETTGQLAPHKNSFSGRKYIK